MAGAAGAAIPHVRVRCSHDALTLQCEAGAQSQARVAASEELDAAF